VVDLIGQHRTEYRLEERFKALVDPSRGTVGEQLSLDFPFLPAGCSINLERVAKGTSHRRAAGCGSAPGIKSLTRDLVALGPISLERLPRRDGPQYRTILWNGPAHVVVDSTPAPRRKLGRSAAASTRRATARGSSAAPTHRLSPARH
jgi:hypothetical protein